jgi:hypothetical protein
MKLKRIEGIKKKKADKKLRIKKERIEYLLKQHKRENRDSEEIWNDQYDSIDQLEEILDNSNFGNYKYILSFIPYKDGQQGLREYITFKEDNTYNWLHKIKHDLPIEDEDDLGLGGSDKWNTFSSTFLTEVIVYAEPRNNKKVRFGKKYHSLISKNLKNFIENYSKIMNTPINFYKDLQIYHEINETKFEEHCAYYSIKDQITENELIKIKLETIKESIDYMSIKYLQLVADITERNVHCYSQRKEEQNQNKDYRENCRVFKTNSTTPKLEIIEITLTDMHFMKYQKILIDKNMLNNFKHFKDFMQKGDLENARKVFDYYRYDKKMKLKSTTPKQFCSTPKLIYYLKTMFAEEFTPINNYIFTKENYDLFKYIDIDNETREYKTKGAKPNNLKQIRYLDIEAIPIDGQFYPDTIISTVVYEYKEKWHTRHEFVGKINNEILINGRNDIFIQESRNLCKRFVKYIKNIKPLKKIPTPGLTYLMYFHNAKYDMSMLYKWLKPHSTTIRFGQFYNSEISTKNEDITVEIRDSYKLLSYPLADIPKNLKIDCKKGDIEHTDNQYKLNDNKYYKDRVEYCKQDTIVLGKAITKFNTWLKKDFNETVFDYLTISQLADTLLKKKGCYDNTYSLTGCLGGWVFKSVRGGRVQTRDNKVWKVRCGNDEKILDLDCNSLYPAAMYRIPGVPKGKPTIVKSDEKSLGVVEKMNEIMKDKSENGLWYVCSIKIKALKKLRNFGVYGMLTKDSIHWITKSSNPQAYLEKIITVDKYTLEDLEKYNLLEYEFINGAYWADGYNDKIKGVIKVMYDVRINYKNVKNPIQEIYKLILNSSYGKTLLKENNEIYELVYNKNFKEIIEKSDENVKGFKYLGDDTYLITKTSTDFKKHFNNPHIGGMILSMSKRIMNEVLFLAEDLDIMVLYTDTDSMFMKIDEKSLGVLEKEYKNRYNRTLIDKKELGAFSSDFNDNLYGIRATFIDKKIYCVETQSEDPNTFEQYSSLGVDKNYLSRFVFRHKGISKGGIINCAKINYEYNILKLYNSNREWDIDLLRKKDGKEDGFKPIFYQHGLGGCGKYKEFTRNANYLDTRN